MLNCQKCGGKLEVIETRQHPARREIYRRRACEVCGERVTTIESDAVQVRKTLQVFQIVRAAASL